MLCVVVYERQNMAPHLDRYSAEMTFAPGELQAVRGQGRNLYTAAGDYLSKLAEFVKRGGSLCEVTEAFMRRAKIRGVSRIRDDSFYTAQFRYPSETLDREELVHFFEGM